ncbi:unnamed protein product [Closterium sp. NIES-53]
MSLTPTINGPGQASSSASSPAGPSPGIRRNRSWLPCHQRKLNSSQQQQPFANPLKLLQEAKIPASANFRLHCENHSAIKIANKSGFVNRTKHIALWYFFVKDEVDKGKVDLTYCPTGEMAADFLTKQLSRQHYQHCSELSGVVKRVKTHYGQE